MGEAPNHVKSMGATRVGTDAGVEVRLREWYPKAPKVIVSTPSDQEIASFSSTNFASTARTTCAAVPQETGDYGRQGAQH
jgi:hypothetical protein